MFFDYLCYYIPTHGHAYLFVTMHYIYIYMCVVKEASHHNTLSTMQNHQVRMEVASLRLDHLPTLTIDKTSVLSLLVKSPFWWRSGRCRHCCSDFLLQCTGDIKMNPGPVLTPTPTNCLRLMQWNANRISGKIP